MEKIYFKEVQRFRQPWLWAILMACDLLVLFLLLKFTVWSPEMADTGAVVIMGITLFLMILMSLLFFRVSLVTEIRESGIYYRFSPLQRKLKIIKPSDIQSVEVKKYNPVMDYGGWGIKHGGRKKGKVYSIAGNMGIFFVFAGGEKFLLGTQKPEAARTALKRLTGKDDSLRQDM